jgi:hypothetical protein
MPDLVINCLDHPSIGHDRKTGNTAITRWQQGQ